MNVACTSSFYLLCFYNKLLIRTFSFANKNNLQERGPAGFVFVYCTQTQMRNVIFFYHVYLDNVCIYFVLVIVQHRDLKFLMFSV